MDDGEARVVAGRPERAGREGDQPLPLEGRGEDILAELAKRILARRATGVRRYGRPLTPFNGRDAHRDQEEEFIDGYVYLRQAALEAEDLELAVVALGRRVRGEDAEFGSVEAALEVAGAVEAKLARRRGGG